MNLKWIWFFPLFLGITATLFGADSTFSQDNRHVYVVQFELQPPRPSGECSIIDIDLEQGRCKKIDLRSVLGERVQSVTLSDAGFVLCATKTAVWAYDPSADHCVKVLDAPQNTTLFEVGHESDGVIFAACWGTKGQELFCLPKNGDRWIPVYNRRSPVVESPVFSADGSLYFINSGDLWAGGLEKKTSPTLSALKAFPPERETSSSGWPESIPVAALKAYRCAPVAFLETQNTTSDTTGLRRIACSQRFVYGDYSRHNGGWGSLIRCARPSSPLPHGAEATGKQAIPILDSVEQVSDKPCLTLCSSRDGSLVFYIDQKQKPFLIKNDGKPEPLEISGLNLF